MPTIQGTHQRSPSRPEDSSQAELPDAELPDRIRWTVEGRHMLITGGTDGIGKAAAIALARAGAILTLVARDPERGTRATHEIKRTVAGSDVTFLRADLGSMASIRTLASEVRRLSPLHALIHSAGIIHLGRSRTTEGVETNFAVNYLGRYLLTALLDDRLEADARVIAMATAGVQPIRFDFDAVTERPGLSGFRAYQQSQAANDVWGAALAERLRPRGVRVAVVAPGIVKTSIRQGPNTPWWLRLFDIVSAPFALTVEQGSETPVHLASDQAWPDGAFFFGAHMKPLSTSQKVRDPAVWAALEKVSARLAPTETRS